MRPLRSYLPALSSLLLAGSLSACGDSPSDDGGGNLAGGPSVGSGGTLSTGGQSSGGSTSGGSTSTGGTPIHPTCPGDASDAYQGSPGVVPGTIEAEDFDTEGYSDATPGNEGGAYRADVDVDIKELSSGYAIGWMMAGEWLEYTVNVAAAGDYRFSFRVGSVEAGRTLEITSCGEKLADIAVPQVAAWGDMATAATASVRLSAGLQVLRITVGPSDYVDFDSFTVEEAAGGSGGSSGSGGAGSGGGPGSGGSSGELPKFVGNITTGNNGAMDTNGRVFSTYWDQVTPENAGKWGSVQPTAQSPLNWSTLDAIYDYAMQKGIIFKQHTFVWGSQQPSGTLTETHVKTWIRQFCERYPETKLIDVVNEPPPHTEPSYAGAIGGGTNTSWQWIINSFRWAREYCPDAILILNDYNNIEWADQNQHFINIANAVKNAGAPIDAVGAQTHGLSGDLVSTDTMKRLIQKLHADTGLPVYITEYDIAIADDNEQLRRYRDHMTFFLETDWIPGITIWGWIHGQTWVQNSGLIRNGAPRPAMTWLMQELGRPTP